MRDGAAVGPGSPRGHSAIYRAAPLPAPAPPERVKSMRPGSPGNRPDSRGRRSAVKEPGVCWVRHALSIETDSVLVSWRFGSHWMDAAYIPLNVEQRADSE